MSEVHAPADPLENRQVERDSQLSAMFDGELPAGECELLARRLTRDEVLRAQWSRFSMIGAALRAERGVALHDRVAWRVQSVVAQEATYGEGFSGENSRTAVAAVAKAYGRQRWMRFGYPVAGASIAAGVAAVSILWMRGVQGPADLPMDTGLQASTLQLPQSVDATLVSVSDQARQQPAGASGEPDRYSTPAPSSTTSVVPPARLANYVVAHSEYSGPLQRRMALLGIVGADADGNATAAPEAPSATEDVDAP